MRTTQQISRMIVSGLLFVVFSFTAYAQDYTIDFSDTSTYEVTCGKVVPGQWSVKDDSCLLYTPYFRVDEETGSNVSFSFRVNQSGNGDGTDNGYVFHSIDDGEWILDTSWTAGGAPQVYSLSDELEGMAYGHYIRFMVALETNAHTEFWAIMGGDIEISDGDDTQSLISVWLGRPPAPPETDPFLPISLVSFTGKAANSEVTLQWSTATEVNNDYFTIERSENGNDFETIGYVKGSGNSNGLVEYRFEDFDPYSRTYYRLRQTDYNGAFSVSPVILVSTKETDRGEIAITTGNGAVNVMTNNTESGVMQINIYSVAGSMVYNGNVNVEEGSNTISVTPDMSTNSLYVVNVNLNNNLSATTKVFFK